MPQWGVQGNRGAEDFTLDLEVKLLPPCHTPRSAPAGFPDILEAMPIKNPRKPKRGTKGKGLRGFNKKTDKPLPDTSWIPWFLPMPTTRTDA